MAKVKKSRCPNGSIRKGSRCVKVLKGTNKQRKAASKKSPKSVKKYKNYKKSSPKKVKNQSKKSPSKIDIGGGCSRQTTSKYMERNSPPFPANQCCGRIMKGNDGDMYVSKSMSSVGHCRWVKLK